MELRRPQRTETRTCRAFDRSLARTLRHRRAAALWARQMVSRPAAGVTVLRVMPGYPRLGEPHLYPGPGDSAVGLRLPLPSLPGVAPDEMPRITPADPMADRGPLPLPTHLSPLDASLPAKSDRSR